MSTEPDPARRQPQAPAPMARGRFGTAWRMLIAVAWLVGFLGFFYSFTLPNNSAYDRRDIWVNLPELLAANFVTFDEQADRIESGWQYFPQRLDLLAVAAVVLAGTWSMGSLLLRALRLQFDGRIAERTVFAFALGLSALSLLTLGCGLAGHLSRVMFVSVMAAAFAVEVILRSAMLFAGRRKDAETPSAAQSRRPRAPRSIVIGSLVAVAPFLLAMLLGSMLPSTDFDVREYHLQGPKEFFRAGRIEFLPHNVYTSFPFLTEMLSLLSMVVRDDWYRGALAGKAVLMAFVPLTGLALYAAGRRLFSPAAGWIAAAVYLTTPWSYRIATIAYTEGGLSFFLFASVLAMIAAIDELRGHGRYGRWIFLTGLTAGSAMACKYPGVLQVVIPLGIAAILFPLVIRNKPAADAADTNPVSGGKRSLAAALAFSAGVAITVGPWLVKNTVETGNPVYPLMYSAFGGTSWNDEIDANWKRAHSPPPPDEARSLHFWLVDVTARNDWLSPLLYGLAPLAFLYIGRNRRVALLWLYAAFLFFAWWAFTHRLDRFWVPMIPVVAVLAGGGATWSANWLWRCICTTAIAAAVLFNLGLITTGLVGFNAFLADMEKAREAAEETAPGIAFLNRWLPPDANVLFVCEAQVFDARFPNVYNTVFDDSIFESWVAQPGEGVPPEEWPLKDTDAIRAKLAAAGITHIVINWQELARYRSSYGYTEFVRPGVFAELQREGVLGPAIATDYQPLDSFPPDWRRELEKWGTGLIVRINGTPAIPPVQVFPVRQSST